MKIIIVSFFLIVTFGCAVGEKATDKDLTYWNSIEGKQRLLESAYNVDFFQLANHFQPQPNGVVCGPTSGAIVLNTLLNDREKYMFPYNPLKASVAQQLPRNAEVRIKMFSPDNFSSGDAKKIKTEAQIFGKPINGKRDFGLQIRQFHEMLLAHRVQSKLRIVDKTLSDEVIKNELIENLKSKNDYVVVNYKRPLLGQEGGGHISPLGAYHKPSDSFLVLDVNPDKYDWVWVKAEKLILAMRSFDTVENRGYVLVSL